MWHKTGRPQLKSSQTNCFLGFLIWLICSVLTSFALTNETKRKSTCFECWRRWMCLEFFLFQISIFIFLRWRISSVSHQFPVVISFCCCVKWSWPLLVFTAAEKHCLLEQSPRFEVMMMTMILIVIREQCLELLRCLACALCLHRYSRVSRCLPLRQNLLEKSAERETRQEYALAMIQCKVLKQLENLEQQKYDDEDITEDIKFLLERLGESVQDLRYPLIMDPTWTGAWMWRVLFGCRNSCYHAMFPWGLPSVADLPQTQNSASTRRTLVKLYLSKVSWNEIN